MAALSAAISPRKTKAVLWSHLQTWLVANADRIYVGSFCCIPGTAGLTSRRGYVTPFSDTLTALFVGQCTATDVNSAMIESTVINSVLGATSDTPVPKISTEGGLIVYDSVVVTSASAQSDVGKAVWLRNDNDFAMTSSQAPQVGRIVEWLTSTTCHVMTYGFAMHGVLVAAS